MSWVAAHAHRRMCVCKSGPLQILLEADAKTKLWKALWLFTHVTMLFREVLDVFVRYDCFAFRDPGNWLCVSRRLAMLGPLSCAVGGCGLSRTHRRSMFDRQPILSHGRGVMIARGIRIRLALGWEGHVKSTSRKECDVQLFNMVICKANV